MGGEEGKNTLVRPSLLSLSDPLSAAVRQETGQGSAQHMAPLLFLCLLKLNRCVCSQTASAERLNEGLISHSAPKIADRYLSVSFQLFCFGVRVLHVKNILVPRVLVRANAVQKRAVKL